MPRIKKASQLGIIHIILILIIPLILIGALVAYLILSKQEVSTSNLIGKIIKPKPPTLDQLQGIWKAEKKFTFDENTQKFKESEFSGSEKDILIEFNGNDFCIGKSASENAQDLKCEGQVAFTLEAENLTLYEPENQTVVWKVHLNIQGKLELEPEMPSGQENIKIILVKAGEPRKVDPQDVANKDKLQGLWVVSQYFVFENGQFREDQIPSQYTKSYLEFKNGKICPGGELDGGRGGRTRTRPGTFGPRRPGPFLGAGRNQHPRNRLVPVRPWQPWMSDPPPSASWRVPHPMRVWRPMSRMSCDSGASPRTPAGAISSGRWRRPASSAAAAPVSRSDASGAHSRSAGTARPSSSRTGPRASRGVPRTAS